LIASRDRVAVIASSDRVDLIARVRSKDEEVRPRGASIKSSAS
jgi:hypothetical protein